jgi:RNA polymerase sigma-70 factor (ECF subfamily)
MADDVTQEVFVAVIRGARGFEAGRAAVPAWLCGIARNFVRRRLTVDRALAPLDDDAADQPLPVVTPDPIGDLTSAERIESLRRAVLSLPLRYREAVVLCDLQEMSYADAAIVLDCPLGTVRSRLNRGRALLASKMQAGQRSEEQPARRRPRITRALA